jgi:hypothetical protein
MILSFVDVFKNSRAVLARVRHDGIKKKERL